LKAEHTPKDGMNARPTEATPATPGGMFQTGRQAFFNRWHEQRQAAAAGQDGTPPAKADAPAAKPLAPLVERLRAAQPAEKLAQAEAHAAAAKRAAERLASRMGMDGHSAG
jgi:hypothetical protein